MSLLPLRAIQKSSPNVVVALSVLNDVGSLGPCLAALAAQEGARLDHVVLLVSNCSDVTVSLARAKRMQRGTTLHVIEMQQPAGQATPGHARRHAMQCAAALAGPGGTLLTTTAEGSVAPDWVAMNLLALNRGVDVVCGWAKADPAEEAALSDEARSAQARVSDYDRLCDRIHALLDPDPHDPLPRHTQASGVSIALTAASHLRCGGVPDIPHGEDRALISALRRVDARIRHAPEVTMTLHGKADGPANALYLNERLEPAMDSARRAISRRRLRDVYETGAGAADLALYLDIDLPRLRVLLKMSLGAAWYELEAESPTLRRRAVPFADLASETAIAEAVLAACEPASSRDARTFWIPDLAAIAIGPRAR